MSTAYGSWPTGRPARAFPRVLAAPAGWMTVYAAAGVLVSLALGAGLTLVAPVPGTSLAGPAPAPPHTFLNLSIVVDAASGFPRYVPANFSIPRGEVTITLTDHDAAAAWAGCACRPEGTVGNVEVVNGTTLSTIDPGNVAHTFSVPKLGISVFSPGDSVVRFTVWLNESGSFEWLCLAPCGSGPDPFTGPPMGVAGFMTGTLTVGA